MAFLEDPRFRQRWNQISHNAETVTENAAAGIWSVQHNYINPCLASLGESLDHCTAVCLGDREERARRRRERERARGRAEYSFDFYDDWYEEEDGGSGMLGGWSYEDWDRLLVGSGSSRHRAGPGGGGGEISEQPRRKRGMSYGGTRGPRRKPPAEDDPTVIPSTQPIGFLGRLPWKIGGTLRYKPSAADLQEHPGHHDMLDENAPLLGGGDDEGGYYNYQAGVGSDSAAPRRKRSSTAGSGGTSDSYRSRGDLFPSDGEEDAVPLDDEFTLPPDRADDRSSNRTRSSKGKRPAGSRTMSRTVSRTTVASGLSGHSNLRRTSTESMNGFIITPSMEDLHSEEARIAQEEDLEIERKRVAATQLAQQRGLSKEGDSHAESDLKANRQPEAAFDDTVKDAASPRGALHTAQMAQNQSLQRISKEEKLKKCPVVETRHEEQDGPNVDALEILNGLPHNRDDNAPGDATHTPELEGGGVKGPGGRPPSLERPTAPGEEDFVPARLPRFR